MGDVFDHDDGSRLRSVRRTAARIVTLALSPSYPTNCCGGKIADRRPSKSLRLHQTSHSRASNSCNSPRPSASARDYRLAAHTVRGQPGLADLLEGPAVAIEQGSLARQHLPTLHHHVHVFRMQFQSMTDPPALFRGRQRRPAAEKRVVDQFPPLGVVLDGALHQRNWFLRGVIELVFPRPTHDEFRGGRIPDGRVLAGLAEPGRILLAHVPAGLVLIPVVGSGEHNPALVPNDLLGIEEADPQQTIQHLPCEDRGVPNVGGLQTSHELERCRPVGTSVRGNGGIGVALGALLHVAGLRGPASVQDNRFGRMVFGLSRVAFTRPVVGRITYQAYATECKVRDEGSGPLSAVLWKIASGTADYREVLREMCGYGVLRSILVGAAVTLRNVAFESLFGLKCGEYGRYSSPRKPSRGKFHYRWQSGRKGRSRCSRDRWPQSSWDSA